MQRWMMRGRFAFKNLKLDSFRRESPSGSIYLYIIIILLYKIIIEINRNYSVTWTARGTCPQINNVCAAGRTGNLLFQTHIRASTRFRRLFTPLVPVTVDTARTVLTRLPGEAVSRCMASLLVCTTPVVLTTRTNDTVLCITCLDMRSDSCC